MSDRAPFDVFRCDVRPAPIKTPEIRQSASIQLEASHFHHTNASLPWLIGRKSPSDPLQPHPPAGVLRAQGYITAHPDAAKDWWLMQRLQLDMEVVKIVFHR